jgi:hypothetical protein
MIGGEAGEEPGFIDKFASEDVVNRVLRARN